MRRWLYDIPKADPWWFIEIDAGLLPVEPAFCLLYNVYQENEDGTQTYNDGTEFPGIGSGSNSYAPSNPALVERVEADIANFLE